jgi:hypothetical protein
VGDECGTSGRGSRDVVKVLEGGFVSFPSKCGGVPGHFTNNYMSAMTKVQSEMYPRAMTLILLRSAMLAAWWIGVRQAHKSRSQVPGI